jgi:hypothetical protein
MLGGAKRLVRRGSKSEGGKRARHFVFLQRWARRFRLRFATADKSRLLPAHHQFHPRRVEDVDGRVAKALAAKKPPLPSNLADTFALPSPRRGEGANARAAPLLQRRRGWPEQVRP